MSANTQIAGCAAEPVREQEGVGGKAEGKPGESGVLEAPGRTCFKEASWVCWGRSQRRRTESNLIEPKEPLVTLTVE